MLTLFRRFPRGGGLERTGKQASERKMKREKEKGKKKMTQEAQTLTLGGRRRQFHEKTPREGRKDEIGGGRGEERPEISKLPTLRDPMRLVSVGQKRSRLN